MQHGRYGNALPSDDTLEYRHRQVNHARNCTGMARRAVTLTARSMAIYANWLQTRLNATADVRLIGTQTLTSRLVDFKTPEEVAQKSFGTVRVPGSSAFSGH